MHSGTRTVALFSALDDFHAPVAVVATPPSSDSHDSDPMVAAWSAGNVTSRDCAAHLALACGRSIHVLDANVRACTALHCDSRQALTDACVWWAHMQGAHVGRSTVPGGDSIVGLAYTDTHLAAATAAGALLIWPCDASAAGAVVEVTDLTRTHGVPAGVAVLPERAGQLAEHLLIVGDVASNAPTLSLWALPSADEAARASAAVMLCRRGAPPRGSTRRRLAASLAQHARDVQGGLALVRDAAPLVALPPSQLHVQSGGESHRVAFCDALGRCHVYAVDARQRSIHPMALFQSAPFPCSDLAWFGADKLVLAPTDGSTPAVFNMQGRQLATCAPPAGDAPTDVSSLATLPRAGPRPRVLAACALAPPPEGAHSGWRLVSINEQTPEETLRALLRGSGWAAAIAFAEQHALDPMPVHAARWDACLRAGGAVAQAASEAAARAAVADTLDGVPDRRWVAAACAAVSASDLSVAAVRAVLAYGLQETQRQCAEAAATPQRLVAYDSLFFFTRARLQLLSAGERLDTLVAVHGGGPSSGAGAAFEALREAESMLDVALAFAAAGMPRGVDALVRHHHRALTAPRGGHEHQAAVWWRAIADAFPMTLSPDVYADALPWALAALHAREPAFARQPDWAEQQEVHAALVAFTGSDSLKPGALLAHGTEHMAARSHAADTVYAPGAVEAAEWALARAKAIDSRAGQTQHVVTLLRRALDGIPRMAQPNGDAERSHLAASLGELRALLTAASDLWGALSCQVPREEASLAAGPWELATCDALAALDDDARVDLLLEGATPGSVHDRVCHLSESLRARLGAAGASQLLASWTRRAAAAGRIECVAALFADLAESEQTGIVFGSADAAARVGCDALFACPRTEASALDAAAQLALVLPASSGASVIVSATRLLASHGSAPTLHSVRAACADGAAATAMLRSLCSHFARRDPRPTDAAWHALWQDVRDIQAGAFTQCMSQTDALALFLQFGPLACGATQAVRRYLAPSSGGAGAGGAVLPAPVAERVVYAAVEALLRDVGGDDVDGALDKAAYALDLLSDTCARAPADMDAIAAFRNMLPQLNVTGVSPALLFGGDRTDIVHAVLRSLTPSDVYQCAGPILALARRLGLSSTQQRCVVELALAERAMECVGDSAKDAPVMESLALARDLCIAVARRGFAPAASLAARVGAHAQTPRDAARELLAFALSTEKDVLALPALLDAWTSLQGPCSQDDDAPPDDEDVAVSSTGGARHGALQLSGAEAAAFSAWQASQVPSDDVCYMLYAADSAAHGDAPEPCTPLFLALAPTASPTSAVAAHGTPAALQAAMTAYILRAAAASGALDHGALARTPLELATSLEAARDLSPEAASQLASFRALQTRSSATAGATALAKVAPDIVGDPRAFAAGDVAYRRRVLLDIATSNLETDAHLGATDAMPPRLAGALSMSSTAELEPRVLLTARLVALLLSPPRAVANQHAVAEQATRICVALASHAGSVAHSLQHDVFPQLTGPSAPLHPRIVTYFRALATLYGAADAAAAQRASAVTGALEKLLEGVARLSAKGTPFHGDLVTMFVSSDGGPPPDGAEPVLTYVADAASSGGSALVALIASVVAALPCPPAGLTPGACVTVAAWRMLLHAGTTWEAVRDLVVSCKHAISADAIAAALLPFVVKHGPSVAPSPELWGIAAGDNGEALLREARDALGLRQRRQMLQFIASAGHGQAAAHLEHSGSASRRLDAADAAADALKAWVSGDQCSALELIAFTDDAQDKAHQLTLALRTAMADGSVPFSMLLTAAQALSPEGYAASDAAQTAVSACVSDACAALVARRGDALLRAVVACLAHDPGEESIAQRATAAARGQTHEQLTSFASSEATPPAAKVAVLEVLTAVDAGAAWPGWAPAPRRKCASPVAVAVEPVAAPVAVAVVATHVEPPADSGDDQDEGHGWADVDIVLPDLDVGEGETATPEATEAASEPPPVEPPTPPPAPSFDASIALLAARTAALVEGVLDSVATADVATLEAASSLFARILDARDRTPGATLQPVAVLDLWERSAAWAKPRTDGEPRPLHALWAAAVECSLSAEVSDALLPALEAAAAAMPRAALLDAVEAARLLSSHASGPHLVTAATAVMLCGHADVNAAALDALLSAAAVDGPGLQLHLVCSVLLVASGGLDVIVTHAQGLPLLARLCAACGDAFDDQSSTPDDREAAETVLTHITAALTLAKRLHAAAAVALKVTRTHAGLATVDAGMALLPRVLRSCSKRGAGSTGAEAPHSRGGSARARAELGRTLPGVCAAAHDALAAAMRE